MKKILLFLISASFACSLSGGTLLDAPIKASSFDEAVRELKSLVLRLDDADSRVFQVAFQRLDIEATRYAPDSLSSDERKRLFLGIVNGSTPRQLILLGCMANLRQAKETLASAAKDERPLRQFDLERAEGMLADAVRRYSPGE